MAGGGGPDGEAKWKARVNSIQALSELLLSRGSGGSTRRGTHLMRVLGYYCIIATDLPSGRIRSYSLYKLFFI